MGGVGAHEALSQTTLCQVGFGPGCTREGVCAHVNACTCSGSMCTQHFCVHALAGGAHDYQGCSWESGSSSIPFLVYERLVKRSNHSRTHFVQLRMSARWV